MKKIAIYIIYCCRALAILSVACTGIVHLLIATGAKDTWQDLTIIQFIAIFPMFLIALILPPWKRQKNKQNTTLLSKISKIINNFIEDRPLHINALIVIGLIFSANLPGGESASIVFNEISNMSAIQAQTFTNGCLLFTSISLYFLYSKKSFNYFTTKQPNKSFQPTPKSGAAEL